MKKGIVDRRTKRGHRKDEERDRRSREAKSGGTARGIGGCCLTLSKQAADIRPERGVEAARGALNLAAGKCGFILPLPLSVSWGKGGEGGGVNVR